MVQFATVSDEAINDWHEAIDKPRVHTTPDSLLSEALEWLLPVLKQTGISGKKFIYHVELVG